MMDLRSERKRIRECAVRIAVGDSVGSGFLYVPKEGKHAYIFTVLHVIKDLVKNQITEKFALSCNGKEIECSREELEYCILAADTHEKSVWMTGKECPQFDFEAYKGKKYEAAVMRCPITCLDRNIRYAGVELWLEEKKLPKEGCFLGYGFPNEHIVPIVFEGIYSGWNSKEELLTYQASNSFIGEFTEMVDGFSGTMLLMEYRDTLIMAGIVLKCKHDEMNRVIEAVKLSDIIGAMKQAGWDVPTEYDEEIVPERFLCPSIQKLLKKNMNYMELAAKKCVNQQLYEIDRQYRPEDIAKNEVFYDIPKCMFKRSNCNHYWVGKVWHLFVEKILEKSNGENFFITKTGEKVRVAFICSEGEGNADIGTVVASAVKHKVLGDQIKGDCILFWQSNQIPEVDSFSKRKFRRIVSDIADGDGEIDVVGYDLLNGEMRTKNYGILHRKYLISRFIECESIDNIEEKIEEILNEIWG